MASNKYLTKQLTIILFDKIIEEIKNMNEEERKYYFMRTLLEMSPDEFYGETKIAEVKEIPSLTATSLTYEKTYEEEMAEKKSVQLAEDFLKKLGITVKTNYGYYRDTYSILKDIGDVIIRSDR